MKKQNGKKFLSVLLTLSMLLGLFVVPVSAASADTLHLLFEVADDDGNTADDQNPTLAADDEVCINVLVSNVPTTDVDSSLSVYEVLLRYDNALLEPSWAESSSLGTGMINLNFNENTIWAGWASATGFAKRGKLQSSGSVLRVGFTAKSATTGADVLASLSVVESATAEGKTDANHTQFKTGNKELFEVPEVARSLESATLKVGDAAATDTLSLTVEGTGHDVAVSLDALSGSGASVNSQVDWTVTDSKDETVEWTITDGELTVPGDAAEDTYTIAAAVKTGVADLTGGPVTATLTVARADSVAASVAATPESVELPTSGTVTVELSAVDQFGEDMVDAEFTLAGDYVGVTLDGRTVTVSTDAKVNFTDGDSFEVGFSADGQSGSFTVTRTPPTLTSYQIGTSADAPVTTDTITIPASGDTTRTYVVLGFDQYDGAMGVQDSGFTWSFATADGSVTAADGTVTVKSGADKKTYTLTATNDADSGITASVTISTVDIDVTFPTVTVKSDAAYGDSWGDILTLGDDGAATIDGETVPGTFSLIYAGKGAENDVTASDMPDAGEYDYGVVFKSEDGAYTVYGGEGTVTVAKRSLTPTIADIDDQTYSGEAIKPTLSINWNGYTPMEVADYTITFDANTDAGTATVTLEPVETSNYTFTKTNKAWSITPLIATLEWSGYDGLTYTGEPANVTAAVSNLIGDDTCYVTVEGGDKTDAGDYTATAKMLRNGNYILPKEATREYTIAQAPLTVSAVAIDAREYDGTTDGTGTITLEGAVGSDAPEATGTFTWSAPDAGTVDFTVTDIALTEAEGNYTLSETTKDGTSADGIAKKAVGVNAPESPLSLKSTETSGDSETYTFPLTGYLAYEEQDGMESGDVSYAITTYGSALTDATATIDGDTLTVTLTKDQALAKDATDTLGVTLSSKNYANCEATLTFKFQSKKDVSDSIVFEDVTRDYDGSGSYAVEATYSGAAADGEWTYTYEGTGDTEYPASAEKPVNAGTYQVTATYEDETETADGVPGSFGEKTANLTINQITANLSWTNTGARTYNGEPANVTATVSNVVSGDECTVTVEGGEEANASTTAYTATATALSNPNYKLPDEPTAAYTINKKDIEVSGVTGVPAKDYDGTTAVASGYEIVLDGVLDADQDAVTVTGTAEWTSPAAGTTTVTLKDVVLSGEKAGNYDLPSGTVSSLDAGETIGKAKLIVTANDKTIAYGDDAANDGVSYAGFVGEENESVLSGKLSYAYQTSEGTAYAAGQPVGDYQIVPSGQTADNYELEFVPGALTVEPKKVSEFTWSGTELTYNGTEQAPAVTAIAGVLSEDKDGVTADVSGAQKNVGSHTATVTSLSGDKAANYAIEGAVGTDFSIAPKQVTIENVAARQENGTVKLYGGEINGLESGDDVTIVLPTDPADFTVEEGVGKDKKVSYTAALDGADKDNYELTGWNDVTVDIPVPGVELADLGAVVDKSGAPVDGAAVESTEAGFNGVVDAAAELAADSQVITDKLKEDAAKAVADLGGNADDAVIVLAHVVEMTLGTDGSGSTTADVSATAKLYATEKSNFADGKITDASKATELTSKELEIKAPVQIKVPFTGSGSEAFVKQTDGGKTFEYPASVAGGQATFEAPNGLGLFTVSETSDAKYKIGDASYDTLQDAVNAVQDGETIKVMQNGLTDTATVSKAVSFTLDKNGTDFGDDNITAGSGYNLTKDGDSFTATKKSGGGGGGSGSSGGSSATGDAVTVPNNIPNGTVSVSNPKAKAGERVVVTPKADEGYRLGSLTIQDSNGNLIPVTQNTDGSYAFTMPANSKVSVSASFEKISSRRLIDVPAYSYYAKAVDWAVAQGVTNGTSQTTFSPDVGCTRAEAVTFLYRAAGSPDVDPKTHFTDVPENAYYAKAVAWALANDITNGMGKSTTFQPNATCTRAQIVTFIAHFAKANAGISNFLDVPVSAYYYDAVGWAVQNGVTNGTGGGMFSPDNVCTRAQIVTFLYRYFNR